MPHRCELLHGENAFGRWYIVVDGDRFLAIKDNWDEACAAYHKATGTWLERPTLENADVWVLINRLKRTDFAEEMERILEEGRQARRQAKEVCP